MNSWQYRYDTGWINRSDWTNVHLGSDTTLNTDSNVTHNLNAPLSDLLVKLYISTDGTDANSFELMYYTDNSATQTGYEVFAVDNNNVLVHTAVGGLRFIDAGGAGQILDAEDYYYKIKIYYLG